MSYDQMQSSIRCFAQQRKLADLLLSCKVFDIDAKMYNWEREDSHQCGEDRLFTYYSTVTTSSLAQDSGLDCYFRLNKVKIAS